LVILYSSISIFGFGQIETEVAGSDSGLNVPLHGKKGPFGHNPNEPFLKIGTYISWFYILFRFVAAITRRIAQAFFDELPIKTEYER
jgi:hypothetical protein